MFCRQREDSLFQNGCARCCCTTRCRSFAPQVVNRNKPVQGQVRVLRKKSPIISISWSPCETSDLEEQASAVSSHVNSSLCFTALNCSSSLLHFCFVGVFFNSSFKQPLFSYIAIYFFSDLCQRERSNSHFKAFCPAPSSNPCLCVCLFVLDSSVGSTPQHKPGRAFRAPIVIGSEPRAPPLFRWIAASRTVPVPGVAFVIQRTG